MSVCLAHPGSFEVVHTRHNHGPLSGGLNLLAVLRIVPVAGKEKLSHLVHMDLEPMLSLSHNVGMFAHFSHCEV